MKKTKKSNRSTFRLSIGFCEHEWEMKYRETLKTALQMLPNLTHLKGKSTEIFYDKMLYVFVCTKCKKLKFWKS